jgi:hypothetical protein
MLFCLNLASLFQVRSETWKLLSRLPSALFDDLPLQIAGILSISFAIQGARVAAVRGVGYHRYVQVHLVPVCGSLYRSLFVEIAAERIARGAAISTGDLVAGLSKNEFDRASLPSHPYQTAGRRRSKPEAGQILAGYIARRCCWRGGSHWQICFLRRAANRTDREEA